MKVAVLVYPGALGINVMGPVEVFSTVAAVSDNPGYQFAYISLGEREVELSGQLKIKTTAYTQVPLHEIDMLLLPGSEHMQQVLRDKRFMAWLQDLYPLAKRICSICMGSAILAQSGLLNGKVSACHWQAFEQLSHYYPQVKFDANSLYIQQGKIWSSAGGISGVDLALAIVRQDYGDDIALKIAKRLVLYAHRPGGQQQFSTMLDEQFQYSGQIQTITQWIKEHYQTINGVAEIAEHWGMSLRNFHRTFSKGTGKTPAQYLEDVRLYAATILLQTGGNTLKRIASHCGFQSESHFLKSFKRKYSVTPGEYRKLHQFPG